MVAVLEIRINLLINSISFLRCAIYIEDVDRLHHVAITFVHVSLSEMIDLYLGIFALCRTQSIIF